MEYEKLVTFSIPMTILYGSGLRRMELLRLRVHDVDKDMKQIRVWNSKGFKHRITTLAVELVPLIERRIQRLGGIWMRIYKTRILRMYGCQLQWQESIKMPIKV
ncbi:MAG: tyrosine-type recombinase/integrase [Pseudomonadota bacterium]